MVERDASQCAIDTPASPTLAASTESTSSAGLPEKSDSGKTGLLLRLLLSLLAGQERRIRRPGEEESAGWLSGRTRLVPHTVPAMPLGQTNHHKLDAKLAGIPVHLFEAWRKGGPRQIKDLVQNDHDTLRLEHRGQTRGVPHKEAKAWALVTGKCVDHCRHLAFGTGSTHGCFRESTVRASARRARFGCCCFIWAGGPPAGSETVPGLSTPSP